MKKNRIIGLIGGMGPYASAYFYKLLLEKSSKEFGAINNNDFPEILIDSIPVPDFISDTNQLEHAKDMLISRVGRLNTYGCTSIAMVCNTGHILYPDLAEISNKVNFISMIQAVSKEVQKLRLKKVGIFATKITLKTRLYQKAFEGTGVEVILPTNEIIVMHEKIIRDVIASGQTEKYEKLLSDETKKFTHKQSLDGIILGCTELPLVFPKDKFNNIIDCLDILADSLLNDYYS
ncbi:MAG: amino acid racemase [Candidatus Woesebacteria bacterium]|jgi:aspartate racemase